jgi:hypothetical protein
MHGTKQHAKYLSGQEMPTLYALQLFLFPFLQEFTKELSDVNINSLNDIFSTF